jgi:acetone carboxylase gamma subunit
MSENKRLTEKDHENFNFFLKFVLDKARWNDLSTSQVLELNKHLSFCNELNGKIKANIFEISKVVEPPPPAKKKTTKRST